MNQIKKDSQNWLRKQRKKDLKKWKIRDKEGRERRRKVHVGDTEVERTEIDREEEKR